MRIIVYLNRLFSIIMITLFLVGFLFEIIDCTLYGLFGGIPYGAFQILISIILLFFWTKLIPLCKIGLFAYYVFVPIYFLLFFALEHSLKKILSYGFFDFFLVSIPVLLAIGITIVIELIYKEAKKSHEN